LPLVLAMAAALALVACGSNRHGDDDADADVDLQVELEYETSCQDGGCPTVDQRFAGRDGDPILRDAEAVLGIACEIVTEGATATLASLQVQDRRIGVEPDLGVQFRSANLPAGSTMACPTGGVSLFDGSEFTGGCEGATDSQCAVLVNEYTIERGRLVLEFDCENLVDPADAATRSLSNGLLTIQCCTVR
jgi:hypothetical protein